MGKWSTPAELKQKLLTKFERGQLLQDFFAGKFPLRLPLSHPGSADIKANYDHSRAWALQWQQEPVQLEFSHISTRLSRQQVPVAVIFPDLEQLALYIRCQRSLKLALGCLEQCRKLLPELVPYLCSRRARMLLDYADCFERFLTVAAYMKQHPRPRIYLRSLDLPGIDTKFVQQHYAPIAELLDVLLPAEAVDRNCSAQQFERRYGFLNEPVLLRFHLLDRSMPENGVFNRFKDCAIDFDSAAALELKVSSVIICENKISYLALPPLKGCLALFGQGYGFARWSELRFLQGRRIIYWGDLDSAGFAILNQLRKSLPDQKVESMLMDLTTMQSCLQLSVEDKKMKAEQLDGLTEGEQEAYQAILNARFAPHLRIEQERIPFTLVQQALSERGLEII